MIHKESLMSAILNNLTITSVFRDETNFAHANETTINDVSAFSPSIVEKLTTLFNTSGLRTGRFSDTGKQPHFSGYLNEHLDDDNLTFRDFKQLSQSFGRLLADELNQNQAKQAKDGFLLTYDYSFVVDEIKKEHYLCVVFLHRINGVNINDQFTLEDIEQINLDSLNLGARISLQAFIDEESDPDERSILFKIGRGSSDIRVYFQNFIGCDEPSDAKLESKDLLKAIEYVCKELNLDEESTQKVTERTSVYCKGLMEGGDYQAELKNLSEYVFMNREHSERFIVVAQETFKLSEYVGLDRSEINKYGDIIVKTDKYRLTIKKTAINDGVKWDSGSEELTITQLPEEIKQQLNNLYVR